MSTVHPRSPWPRRAWLACLVVGLWALASAAAGDDRRSTAERPAPALTAAELDLIELGRRLFFDPALSAEGRNACVSCHEPDHGFSDPRARSEEAASRTLRHSQGLVDVDVSADQHWDGEFVGVAALVEQRARQEGTALGYGTSTPDTPGRRVRSPDAVVRVRDEGTNEPSRVAPELGLRVPPSVAQVGTRRRVLALKDGRLFEGSVPVAPQHGAHRLELAGRYVAAGTVDLARAGLAVQAYVGSITSGRSPYDRHRAKDAGALSEGAARGLALFRGRAGCVACHREQGPGGWPVLRDGFFHNNGVAWTSADRALFELVSSKGAPRAGAGYDPGRGRFAVAVAAERTFKTPSLRDVARRPPYMHDGSKATLAEVVRYYAAGCGDDPQRDARLKGFEASEQDVADLVAFLESLTSETRPGLARVAWTRRVPRTRLTFVDAKGTALAGLEVGLAAAGDPVPVASPVALPAQVTADAEGRAEVPFPATTHVRLLLPGGLVAEGGDLVPDCCAEARIVVATGGPVALELRGAGQAWPDTLVGYGIVGEPGRPGALVAIQPEPWRLRRTTEGHDGKDVARYAGWRVQSAAGRLLFRLPEQAAPQEVRLEPEGTTVVTVDRAGSPAWRALVRSPR